MAPNTTTTAGGSGQQGAAANKRRLLAATEPVNRIKYEMRPRSRENFLRPEVTESLFYLWRATGTVCAMAVPCGCCRWRLFHGFRRQYLDCRP
jgi:hypothetical protein